MKNNERMINFCQFVIPAKKIEENRDVTVDPCENFYQYACGSWNKHNPIPDNKVEWSEDEIKANKTNNRIRGKKLFLPSILFILLLYQRDWNLRISSVILFINYMLIYILELSQWRNPFGRRQIDRYLAG